jgi:hypothetical protein
MSVSHAHAITSVISGSGPSVTVRAVPVTWLPVTSLPVAPPLSGGRVINTLCEKIITLDFVSGDNFPPRVLIYHNTFIQRQYVYTLFILLNIVLLYYVSHEMSYMVLYKLYNISLRYVSFLSSIRFKPCRNSGTVFLPDTRSWHRFWILFWRSTNFCNTLGGLSSDAVLLHNCTFNIRLSRHTTAPAAELDISS